MDPHGLLCSLHPSADILAEPHGSAFVLYFVQCASCGGVVGVQEYHNIGAMLKKQQAAIKKLANGLNVYIDFERL